MTCKDCIYLAMCYKHEHYGYGEEYNEKPCEMFKNKADFVEVRHGRWKWEKKIEPQAQNRLYCSVCDNECLGKNNYYVKTKYCPHCFARMDGTPKERGGEK